MTENLSAKFEYDYFGFGSKTYNFAATPVSIRSDLQTLTVGLNYRFTWAAAPLPWSPAKTTERKSLSGYRSRRCTGEFPAAHSRNPFPR